MILKDAFERFGLQVASTKHYGIRSHIDIQRIRPADQVRVIVDIGAHHGMTVRKYAAHFPKAHIHAFEPDPRNMQQCRVNTFDVDKRVTYVQKAVSDTDEGGLLRRAENDAMHQLVAPGEDPTGAQPVPTVTIDHYAAEHGLTHVDILKTDTEGRDIAVLRGASGLLAGGRVDFVYAECTFVRDNRQNTLYWDLEAFLAPCGFRLLGLYDQQQETHPARLVYADALFTRL